MTAWHFYEPANGHRLPHDPFNAIVAPRPIGWIGSVAEDGSRNLAPYSFFNAFNYRPPIVGFCSVGWKDSVANIEATGNFTWNLATRALSAEVNASSAMLDPHIDEFAVAGVDALPSTLIAADRVAGSPVQFECRHTQTLRLKTKEGTDVDAWVIFGEVIGVHIDPAMLEDGIYQTARARPISRGGGPGDYFETHEDALFRMYRPA